MFDLLPVGAYRSTPDGRQLRANQALVRMNGYSSEAELVAAVRDIAGEWYVEPARRAEFRRLLDTTGRVQGFVSEVYRHRTRERIWVSENAHLVRDTLGNVLCYEGTVEEVTERMRTQQALAHSEAQLRVIAQQLPGVVYLSHIPHEGQPRFLFISEGVRTLYGVEPEQALRDGRLLQRMRHPEDDGRVRAGLATSEWQMSTHQDEFRIVRADGAVRWVQATSAPVRRAPDGVIRTGVIFDVTERREAAELRSERDRAEAARRATAGLLARLSHELRTPLNAVLGFAQLLERDPTLGPRQQTFAAESLRAGRLLLALLDDVLDLGRAESGQFALQLGPVDPAEPLALSHSLLVALAAEQGVQVTLPAGPLPRVLADAQRLRQVLTNLLSNAIKYNRRGGWVRVAVAQVGQEVVIAVSDSGPGLDSTQQAQLFQPFNRLGAERGPVAGTGLGLALSQQLARAMGGNIGVHSTPGEGACFSLRLPAA
ncbi:MAG: PAS domain-containing sensor histidine kinase [Rubrivivax sp.]|nr:PAS domain-containing sensor histidine kinase [Rubrivivax sp.]